MELTKIEKVEHYYVETDRKENNRYRKGMRENENLWECFFEGYWRVSPYSDEIEKLFQQELAKETQNIPVQDFREDIKKFATTFKNMMTSNLDGDYGVNVNIDGEDGAILYLMENGYLFARIYLSVKAREFYVIDNLSVDVDSRRKGLATSFMRCFIEQCLRLNVRPMLWVKEDSWMRKWYERLGFVYYGDYEGERGCVWMVYDDYGIKTTC
jgi:GNAT superfamily N-acetyltransferase